MYLFWQSKHAVKHVSSFHLILEGSWVGVKTVKFVFKTAAQVNIEGNLKENFYHVNICLEVLKHTCVVTILNFLKLYGRKVIALTDFSYYMVG